MKLVIDTNILGKLCHPGNQKNRPVATWFAQALTSGNYSFYVPSIADYELRRKLIQLVETKQATEESIKRLDQLGSTLDFIELEGQVLKRAANLWARARMSGKSTAGEDSIDGDVLIAAQALDVGGAVLTDNRKHLERYFTVKTLAEIMTSDGAK